MLMFRVGLVKTKKWNLVREIPPDVSHQSLVTLPVRQKTLKLLAYPLQTAYGSIQVRGMHWRRSDVATSMTAMAISMERQRLTHVEFVVETVQVALTAQV